MGIKNVMLITFVLLAILTVGAVSASDEADFNETLTVDDVQETVDVSLDDDGISGDGDGVVASSESDVLSDDSEVVICQNNEDSFNIGSLDDIRDDINCWVSEHESKENNWAALCDVWVNDNVNEGSITLVIGKDGESWSDEKIIGEGELHWNLEDIGFIDDYGDYTINVTYSKDGDGLSLLENHIFTLTELNYPTSGYVYIASPFDVIRFYSEEDEDGKSTRIEVYVNDEPRNPSEENPFRWKLEDLEIDHGDSYTVHIKSYLGDDFIEEFTYTLNVDDNLDNVKLYSNDLGVESWEVDNPALYLACPDGMIGNHFTLKINGEYADDFDAVRIMNWTLDNLGIDHNEGYDIRLYNEDGDEIASAWLNVNGIISEDCFNWYILSHESISYNPESYICEVWINNVDEGIIILSIENSDGDIQEYNGSVRFGTDA